MNLKKIDKKYVWHPFTQMKEWTEDEILIIDKGKGSYVRATDKKWYLDGISSLWVTVHGHNNTQINNAIKNQIDEISHSTLLGLANKPSILLAKELVDITPYGLEKVFYSDAGSTAVEIALKIAFQYYKLKNEKRKYFIKFKDTYHGDTLGSVSVGGMKLFHDIYKPLIFKTLEAPWPHTYWKPKHLSEGEWKKDCLDKLEKIIKKHNKKIIGIITEPLIQGASGMSTAPKYFLKEVQRLCKKYNILLIVDEVATGFGRTGKMFACEWENIKPDIMCIAKGLTGGYLPLAATLTTNKIYNAFLGDYKELKTFFHGHTYTGNPLGCAASLANLKLFKKNKTLDKLQKKISVLKDLLKPFKKLKHVGDIRKKGFMVGIELIQDKENQIPYDYKKKMGIKVCKHIRSYNIILRPLGNVIILIPHLTITLKELKYLVSKTYLSIKEVTEK